MNTPTNGPSSVNGKIVTALAASRPFAVFCWSALNTTDATSAAWKIPSPPCPHRRIHRSLRKSGAWSADRTRDSVPGCEGTLMAREHTGERAAAPTAASAERRRVSDGGMVRLARHSRLCLDAGARRAVDDLERRVAVGELLDHLPRLVVAELHGRALHEVRARADDRAADAPVLRELRATQSVDDHARGVRRIPDLELHLDVQGDVAEVAALEPDHRPLAVLEPRDVVARADVDVLLRQRLVELGLDRVRLGDLLRG